MQTSSQGNFSLKLRRFVPRLVAALFVVFLTAGAAFGATVQTDKEDYAPGETVVITGSGWQPYETVSLLLQEDPITHGDITLFAVADALGKIYNDEYSPEVHDNGVTYTLTATGLTSGLTAQTTFTDASIDFQQCLNDSDDDGHADNCSWSTGAINAQNSAYSEGDAVAQRLFHTIDTAGAHTMTFRYEFSKADVYAYDFVTSPDLTQSGALLNECGDLPGFVTAGTCAALYSHGLGDTDTVLVPIPSDPYDAVSSRETPANRYMVVGCSPSCSGVSISFPSINGGDDPGEAHDPDSDPDCFQDCGDSNVVIDLHFTTSAAGTTVGVWYAGHLSSSFDPNPFGSPDGWGEGFGSGSISGAPFHFKYNALDGEAVGKRDNQIQPGVIIIPGTIIVEKQTIPNGATGSFTFTGDAAGTISDDGQIIVSSLAPGTYTSTENDPTAAGFDLSTITCDDSDSTGDVGARTATFNLQSGETITCVFTNVKRGRILVDKVTNPSGDTTSFEFDPDYGANFFLADGDTPNDSGPLAPGTYSVAEVNIPSGWDLTSSSCSDGSPVNAIVLGAGETVTCTFTDTRRGHIIVDKVTDPSGDPQSFDFDAGGGSYADFSLTDAAAPNDQELVPGTYSVSETVPSGWDLTSSSCDDGSPVNAIVLGAGETVTCTFTNTKAGRILVDKVTNPSGSSQSFEFDPDYGANFFLTDAAASNNSGPLAPGTYSVAEVNIPAGWDLTNTSCTDGSPVNAIVLGAGETVTCTFTDTQRGKILVDKVTIPAGSSQSFEFDSSYGANFNLTDAAAANDSGPLTPGTYSVAEVNIPSDWDLTSATCSDGSPVNAIVLGAGETVTCTFTDTQRGKILVDKVTIPAGSSQSFEFDSSYGANFNLTDAAAANDSGPLTPGTYSVEEVNIPTDWDLTSATCDDGSPVNAIDLGAGETVTCTFTDTQRGKILVDKVTIPSGSSQSFEFDPDYGSNFSLTDAAAPNDSGGLVPGTYSVAEVNIPSGWDLTSATCDDGSPVNSIDLSAGETVTCTFTDTQRGRILVDKVTIPGGSSQSFEFDPDYGSNFSLTDAAAANDSGPLAPGTYSVAEVNIPSGWDLTSATCDDGSPVNAIDLGAGETITCTFTDTQRGRILVDKVTDPSGSSVMFEFDSSYGANFFLTDAAAANDSGLLQPGSYSVAEVNVPAGWDLQSATCDDGSNPASIDLGAGETVTCTFINRLQRGHIIIDKVTDPSGDSQSFDFTLTGGVSALNQSFGLTDADTPHDSGEVLPGSGYAAAETVPSGWDLTSATCDDGSPVANINVSPGETVTCTFTNTKRGMVIVIKTVLGTPPSGTDSFTFQLRQGASATDPGTILESGTADAGNGGVINFSTKLEANATYQLCEVVMPGWMTSLPDFYSVFNPDGDNSVVCTDFTVLPGETKTFVVDNTPPPGGLARTIGFWKNWSSCSKSNGKQDPVLDDTLVLAGGSILIGDLSVSTCPVAVDILDKRKVKNAAIVGDGKKMASDPAFGLAAQLLAAKLNVVAGAGACPAAVQAINDGQALLDEINFNGNSHDSMTNAEKNLANSLASTLDQYNNNLLCF